MILKYFLWALLAYFLYRFIFNFIIPVFRASRDIKKQVNEFKSRMQEQQSGYQQADFNQASANAHSHTAKPTSSKEGDYIEFEEMR